MHIEEVELVKDDTADENGVTDLMRALKNKENLAQIKLLVDKGANVNAKDSNSDTPIMYTMFYDNNKEITYFLINQGANVNARDNFNRTAIEYVNAVIRLVPLALGKKDYYINIRNLLKKYGAK